MDRTRKQALLLLFLTMIAASALALAYDSIFIDDSPNRSAMRTLRDGKLESPSEYFELSPFILDDIITESKRTVVFDSEQARALGQDFVLNYRFLMACPGELQVELSGNNRSYEPYIWLYDSKNRLIDIADPDQRENRMFGRLHIKSVGIYRLRMRFNPGDISAITLEASTKGESVDVNEYLSSKIKTIHLDFATAQLTRLGQLKRAAARLWSEPPMPGSKWPLYPSIKEKVVGRIKSEHGRWALASVGLSGRSGPHAGSFPVPSLDIDVNIGELPYGLKSFKLYLLGSKGFGRDLVFEQTLKDFGLLIPLQDIVGLFVNGKFIGYMELLEGVDTHFFENAQVSEGAVLGYDADSLVSKHDDSRFVPKSYHKGSTYPLSEQLELSSHMFAEKMNRFSMSLAIGYATCFAGNHGLGQADMRYHVNTRTDLIEPIIRDFNSGVGMISLDSEALLVNSFHTLSTFAPWFRPNVPSAASYYVLKNANSTSVDPMYLWSAMPATLTFLENQENFSLSLKAVQLFGENWVHELIKRRSKNFRYALMSKAGDEQLQGKMSRSLSMIDSYNLQSLLVRNGLTLAAQEDECASTDYVHRMISATTIPISGDFDEILRSLTWRNGLISKLLDRSNTANPQAKRYWTKSAPSNIIAFLFRQKNDNIEHMLFVQRNLGIEQKNDDFYFLLDGKERVDPQDTCVLGDQKYSCKFLDIYLDHFYEDENIKIYHFAFPSDQRYHYLTPIVKGSLKYLGPRELSLTPREKIEDRIEEVASAPLEQYFKVNGSEIILKEHVPPIAQALVIPKDTTWKVRHPTQMLFKRNGGLIIYGGVEIGEGASLTLSGENWRGVHFHKNGNVFLRNLTIDGIGDGKTYVTCGGNSYTGGLSFYDTKVMLENVHVSRAMVEDGIHFLRSEATLNKVVVSGCQSDAIDADFCFITMDDSAIEENLGDGLDVSGSLAYVTNSRFRSHKDKGISAGESSIVYVEHAAIENANVGIATKDGSLLEVCNTKFHENTVAIAIYNKKSWFGKPEMIEDGSNEFLGNMHNIEQFSDIETMLTHLN